MSDAAPPKYPASPKWGSTVKLIAGLTLVAVIAALVIYSRPFIGPLLLTFIITYLLHPAIRLFSRITHLSWRLSVNLIYLVLIILVVAFFTVSGVALVNEIQNLIGVVQSFVTDLPNIVSKLSTQVFTFGPFQLNMAKFDLITLSQELLSYVSPLLSRLGGLVSTFATSAASTLSWGAFVLIVSYFILADASSAAEKLLTVEVPGYENDIHRLTQELGRIWNAFLRGQMIIFAFEVIAYTILLAILGVHYGPAIALLAGLSKFVPYVGPFTAWTVTGLVTFFQGSNYFGLLPWQYTLLVVVLCIILDQGFDSLVSPRLMGSRLGVHPAAVMIAAFIAASLIGIIGLILAAPVLATLSLLGRYTMRKMLDLDPWEPVSEPANQPGELPWKRTLHRARAWYEALRQKRV